MELTRADYDVLIEALEAWESKGAAEEKAVRKELSILLRAKLIQMRDAMVKA